MGWPAGKPRGPQSAEHRANKGKSWWLLHVEGKLQAEARGHRLHEDALYETWAEATKAANVAKATRPKQASKVKASASTFPQKQIAAPEPAAVRAKAVPSVRNCLRCSNTFESEGKHNRMCSSCSKAISGISEYEAP